LLWLVAFALCAATIHGQDLQTGKYMIITKPAYSDAVETMTVELTTGVYLNGDHVGTWHIESISLSYTPLRPIKRLVFNVHLNEYIALFASNGDGKTFTGICNISSNVGGLPTWTTGFTMVLVERY
jgi:hypothetical protein